ncbi:MAG: cyclic nucleotide-binding domain-containing protein [Candidatus Latescibacteria bacterium]|nr:cyclic nucleotide-binding domain-containing protein [Candidatus Latescibacterota bacterium]
MKKEYRRSGFDRRRQDIPVEYDQRKSKERRSVIKDSEYIIEYIKSIQIFNGLNDKQYREILNICRQINVPENHTLFKNGDESNELYVLLWGQLKVVSGQQKLLVYITPVGSIGEIGVLCGLTRFADVVSTTESRIIIINKSEFLWLLNNDHELSNIIYRNTLKYLIHSFSDKSEIIKVLAEGNNPIIL